MYRLRVFIVNCLTNFYLRHQDLLPINEWGQVVRMVTDNGVPGSGTGSCRVPVSITDPDW